MGGGGSKRDIDRVEVRRLSNNASASIFLGPVSSPAVLSSCGTESIVGASSGFRNLCQYDGLLFSADIMGRDRSLGLPSMLPSFGSGGIA